MKVYDTAIADVKLIEPRVFEDERGYFFESFKQEPLQRIIGADLTLCKTINPNQV